MSRLNEYENPKEESEAAMAIIRLADLLSTTTADLSTAPNMSRAKHLYQRAIDKHQSTTAMYKLAILLSESPTRTPSNEEQVLSLLHRAADNDHAPSHAELGLIHHFGWGPCDKHATQAAFHFERAVQLAPIVSAMYYLASLLIDGYDDKPPNAKAAIALLERAVADGNDADSMVFLAGVLSKGHADVCANASRAASLLERAANLDHPAASHNLATLCLQHSDDFPRDEARAALLFQSAIDKHEDPNAMFQLALLLKTGYAGRAADAPAAVKLLRRAIDMHTHYDAMAELAHVLRTGAAGIPCDDNEATDLLRRIDADILPPDSRAVNIRAANALQRAAENNDVYALVAIALHHKGGDPPFDFDTTAAKHWLKKGIAAGCPDAMFHLALLLLDDFQDDGESAPDTRAALALLNRAVEEGRHVKAMNLLANFYSDGYGDIEPDMQKAAALYERGVQLRDPYSINRLAMLHAEQLLPARADDTQVAVRLFRDAADLCDGNAAYNLARMLRNGYADTRADEAAAALVLQTAVANKAHFRCLIALADLLYDGYANVAANRIRAEALIEQAVDIDDIDGMNLCTVLQQHGYSDVASDSDASSTDSESSVDRSSFYRRAVDEGGFPIALYGVGCLIQCAQLDVCADESAAVRWFTRAIDKGNDAVSVMALARLLLKGYDREPADVRRAMSLLEEAVALGSIDAMNVLGLLLQKGSGDVEANGDKACAYFQRAVDEHGDDAAMVNLGCLLREGYDDVKPDIPAAMQLFERAIKEAGNPKAMTELAIIFVNQGKRCSSRNRNRAMLLLQHAVNADASSEALFTLGRLLQLGYDGMAPDISRARSLYERAVEDEGDIRSMYHLAVLLLEDCEDAEDRDAGRIVELLEEAIEEGNDDASMTMLGIICHGGRIATQDTKKAISLFRQAIDVGGNTTAMICLAACLDQDGQDCQEKKSNADDILLAAQTIDQTINSSNSDPAQVLLPYVLKGESDTTGSEENEATKLYKRAMHLSRGAP